MCSGACNRVFELEDWKRVHPLLPRKATCTYGYRLYYVGLQAPLHMVTGCITWGYRVHYFLLPRYPPMRRMRGEGKLTCNRVQWSLQPHVIEPVTIRNAAPKEQGVRRGQCEGQGQGQGCPSLHPNLRGQAGARAWRCDPIVLLTHSSPRRAAAAWALGCHVGTPQDGRLPLGLHLSAASLWAVGETANGGAIGRDWARLGEARSAGAAPRQQPGASLSREAKAVGCGATGWQEPGRGEGGGCFPHGPQPAALPHVKGQQ